MKKHCKRNGGISLQIMFLTKTLKKQQQQNKKANIKNPCLTRGLNLGPLALLYDVLSLATRQLNISFAVKLFNYYSVMH